MLVVVTGAGTMLGGAVVAEMIRRGNRCVASYRRESRAILDLAGIPGVETIQADLRSPDDTRALFRQKADAVVHLAATSDARTSLEIIEDNILGTANLVKASTENEVGKFIFASSMSVYGDVRVSRVTEATPVVNPSTYGLSKLVGERLVEASYSSQAGVSLRLPAILGPLAHRHWLATVTSAARDGREIRIHNPNAPFNNAVCFTDVASLIGNIVHSDAGGYHPLTLGASGSLSILDVVTRIKNGLASNSPISINEKKCHSFTIGYDTASSMFGYDPMSISDMLDAYVTGTIKEGKGQ
jgi:Nucleoside-diphosphate-sugar epimerases